MFLSKISDRKVPLKSLVILSAIIVFYFTFAGRVAAETVFYQGKPAKYIFLFIGDGMGTAQRTAAQKYVGAQLVMDSLPAQGITTTSAADRSVTDSAAAGTALASGCKTNVGMLGMAPDRKAVKSIAEMARNLERRVGIVSSVSLDHATPAAFYTHVPVRRQYYDIGLALVQSGFDFFGGGGLLDPANEEHTGTTFKGDIFKTLKSSGYQLISSKKEFLALKPGDGKIFAENARLPDGQALPYALDMENEDISLVGYTAKAIELLDNPAGFFLMVEGGKIDWACHGNDAATAIQEILVLDKALQEAVDFAREHPKETLVVITSDHETGGLSLEGGDGKNGADMDLLENQRTSFQRFSDEIFPRYRSKCGDNCSFDSVKPLISEYFGLRFNGDAKDDPLVLTEEEIAPLKTAFKQSLSATSSGPGGKPSTYGGITPLTGALIGCLADKVGLKWASDGHTDSAVTTSAMGVGSDTFDGSYDNTDVAKKIMAVMGVKPNVHLLEN